MESYENVLAIGGKANSLGRAAEVIADVYENPSRLNELFDCISADDAWVRMRAIDSFEKIIKNKPEWAQPYLAAILDDLTGSTQPSVQWHIAQIVSEVELTPSQKAKAIAWLKARVETVAVDWIVSVNVMKALLYFYRQGLVSSEELRLLFAVQENHASKSVRKKAQGFRQLLAAGEYQ